MFAPLPPPIADGVRAWRRVPYRDGGRDLSGWDCWGLVAWVGREAFGDAHQEFAGVVSSVQDDRAVALTINAKLPLYEPCVAAGGAVVLLRSEGLPLHVGLMLAPTIMLHALQTIGTISTDLSDVRERSWKRRVMGFYRLRVNG